MTFDPGIASMRAAGIPVTRAPYESGAAGIRQSLDAMALKMREGKVDIDVLKYANKALKEAGLDGRDRNTTPTKQAKVLLEALRADTIYTPDPYGTELIPSAAATLCLRPGLCISGQDCDGLSVAYGSLTLSIGIPTQIVKQNFGADAQEHVLIAVHVDGDWKYADPSTKLPFGTALQAIDEVWVDPMDPIGTLPEAAPEIVTLGRPADGYCGRCARAVTHNVLGTDGIMHNHACPTLGAVGAGATPHWPIGAGAILGYPMIQDLIELLNTAAYNLQQLQAAVTACPNGFDNAIEWGFWKQEFTQLQADFDAVTKYVNQYVGDQPKWTWKFSVVFYPWDMVREIVDREIDLDRRWRQFGGANCAPPTYPSTPQPSVDPDLVVLQASDTALKSVKAVADKVVQPAVIGTTGIAIGIVATLAGFFMLDRFTSRRR